MRQAECPGCQLTAAASEEETYLDTAHWRAQTVVDAPGWVLLSLKRHAEGFWSLRDDEASSLGPILAALGKALQDDADGEKIHVYAMGERVPHLHVMIVPRKPDETPIFDGPGLDARGRALADRDRALALVEAVRASLGVTAQ